MEGVFWGHSKNVVTVFSAPNYLNSLGNTGGLLRVSEGLEFVAVSFEAAPRDGEAEKKSSPVKADFFL
jgi:hypothetical protein